MSKKSSALAAAGILAAAVVLSGFSIYKDSHQKNSTDGTITLRMAQTSSQAGAIGQSMEAFADRIYDETEGKYKIETYHNGQLGAEIDTIEGSQMGYRSRQPVHDRKLHQRFSGAGHSVPDHIDRAGRCRVPRGYRNPFPRQAFRRPALRTGDLGIRFPQPDKQQAGCQFGG